MLSDVTTDEFGTRGETLRADFAQINLNAVLFAVADTRLDTPPELRTPKVAEQALISVPPFKVTGSIYLMPGHNLREALAELTGNFVPVTTATYWSDVLGEARQTAELVAVNHERAQILAPLVIVDPWADLEAPAPGATTPGATLRPTRPPRQARRRSRLARDRMSRRHLGRPRSRSARRCEAAECDLVDSAPATGRPAGPGGSPIRPSRRRTRRRRRVRAASGRGPASPRPHPTRRRPPSDGRG